VEAVTYFVLPDESPTDADRQPRKGRKSLRFDTIQAAFLGASDEDKAAFDPLNAGIVHMHAGAHPSAEGMTQLWAEEGERRVFGPTYSRHLCAFALNWGLTAHVALLNEVNKLRPQGDGWVAAYNEFFDRCAAWQHQYNAEFSNKEEDLEGAAVPSSN